MAVAVKNSPETAKRSVFDALPVAVLAGIVYLLVSLALVFKAIPELFASVSYTGLALQAMAMVAAAAVLTYVGVRLVAAHPARGLLPGIFVGLIFLFITAVIASWLGFWFENRFLEGWFLGSSETVGAIAAGIISLALMGLAVWAFLRPGVQTFLGMLDDQGWFSVRAHKRNQGVRVRRGTIVGIWLLIFCGVWIMIQRSQITPDSDWTLDIPFSGKVQVQKDTLGGVASVKKWAGDTANSDLNEFHDLEKKSETPVGSETRTPQAGDWTLAVDRFTLRDFNQDFAKRYVKIKDQGDSAVFEPGDVVTDRDLQESRKAQEGFEKKPETTAPDEVSGKVKYQSLTILPHTKYTLPLLIVAATLWFAWRIVNVPMFADFLIATEAELNKVSWTTRRRLIQDTIVVLVTVLLTAIFLFAADAIWSASLKWIGVLKSGKADSSAVQEPPW